MQKTYFDIQDKFSSGAFRLLWCPETISSYIATQFTGSGFKDSCKSLAIEHISSYHPRSNVKTERFVDTFKRFNGMNTAEGRVRQFLNVYRITLTPNVVSGMAPAQLIFGRKLRSVFIKLLAGRKQKNSNNSRSPTKYIRPGG